MSARQPSDELAVTGKLRHERLDVAQLEKSSNSKPGATVQPHSRRPLRLGRLP